MQKIDPIIGGLTECTNAIWRWQAEDGQQYTTASFHKTLLSTKMAGGQYKLRHPPLLQLNV